MTSPQKPVTSTRRREGASVVKLAVHKNTLAKRRSQDLRDALVMAAKEEHAAQHITGFIVAFVAEDGSLSIEVNEGTNKPHVILRNAADALVLMATQRVTTEVINETDEEEDQQS